MREQLLMGSRHQWGLMKRVGSKEVPGEGAMQRGVETGEAERDREREVAKRWDRAAGQ